MESSNRSLGIAYVHVGDYWVLENANVRDYWVLENAHVGDHWVLRVLVWEIIGYGNHWVDYWLESVHETIGIGECLCRRLLSKGLLGIREWHVGKLGAEECSCRRLLGIRECSCESLLGIGECSCIKLLILGVLM